MKKIVEVFLSFSKLGISSFGGPVAHIGFFRSEFVTRKRWIDDSTFGDLVALCQFLPGPASSQLAYSIGFLRAGFFGAIVASICFTLPSALLMISFAYAVMDNHTLNQAGWVHGLKLAATVVVAQAAWGMSKNLCPDISRKILCLVCTAFLLWIPRGWVQICVLFLGGLVGGWFFRVIPSETLSTSTAQENSPVAKQTRTHFAAGLALTLFFALFLLLPALAVTRNSKPLKVFDSFYRSGALVFGGGHVVLPLLHDEVVPTGWIEDDQFLAGYGAVQAMPGPLFTFSGYLGAMIFSESKHPWLGGLLCVIAIFLPAWLLIGGALPFWHYWRRKIWVQAALKGANAAVVGILLSAFFQTVLLEGIHSHWDILLAIIAFLLLEIQHVSPIIIVSGCTAICFLTTKA